MARRQFQGRDVHHSKSGGFFFIRTPTGRVRAPDLPTANVSSSPAPVAVEPPFVPNQGSYYGLNIPVSMGKRAILGVPIFASAVKVRGSARFLDFAVAFGESGVPTDELIDMRVTKLWINGELVEETNTNEGWNTSGSLDYVLYPGSENQLPDPRIQKWLGEDQTPAFRDLTYMVFYDFPLHQYSNDFAVPIVRAELTDIVQNVVQVQDFSVTGGPGLKDNGDVAIPNWERNHLYTFTGGSTPPWTVRVIDITNNIEIAFSTIRFSDDTQPQALQITSNAIGAGQIEPDTGFVLTQNGENNKRPLVMFNPYTGIITDQFGDTGSGTLDTLEGAAAHSHRGAVSRSGSMRDRLMCSGGFVRGGIAFWRISKSGGISPAYIDTDLILGDDDVAPDFGGEVRGIITGDKIQGTNKGFGTVLVARERALYRITVPEGITGDGNPIDVETDKTPLHLPPVANDFGGTQSQAYVDLVEIWDVTNLATAATENDLATGQPTFAFDLVDAGDLSAAALDDRVVAYIKYESAREFRQFFMNTRALDNLHTGGIVEYDVVVSDDAVTWTLVSDSNITNTGIGLMVGTNAPSAVLSSTALNFNMEGEGVYDGEPFSPLPSGQYVGFALRQKDYTNGSVTALTPWAGGRDGLEVIDGTVSFPDILVPHMIKLWDAPTGHSIRMIFMEPKSEDIIVFFQEDPLTSTPTYITRLEMNEDILGLPTPTDPDGAGTDQKYLRPLERNMDSWAGLRHNWSNSDLTSNTLAVASTGGGDQPQDSILLFSLTNGGQTLVDFGTEWRFFGAESDEPSTLQIQDGQVWSGAGTYLMSQWDSDFSPEFGYSRLLPFKTDVTGYPLSDMLRWMSLRVGYTADDIDTTSITDTVLGSILLARVSFRDLTGNLSAVYDFDTFESEGKIKFQKTKRGGSFVIDNVLTAADLAPVSGGEAVTEGTPTAAVSRSPVNEIPTAVELTYLDPTSDYTVNTAFQRRTRFPVNTTSNLDVEAVKFSVPVIMLPEEAGLRASRLLYQQWSNQASISFRVTTNFLTMEPADVVSLPVDGVTYIMKNTETVINADNSVSASGGTISGEEIDAVVTQSPLSLPQTVSGLSASELFFMDIPSISPSDVTIFEGQGLVYYSAVTSKGQGAWVSGDLLFNQNSASFSLAYTNAIQSDAAGVALNALPKGVEHVLDHENELSILLLDAADTFGTITYQELLDGGNLCAYGVPGRWEIIQVQTVTNTSGDVFVMTDIVRGLRGTEAYSGAHQPNDQFIVLDRPPVEVNVFAGFDKINQPILMKAVGQRQDAVDISPEEFNLSAAFPRMLPPTNLKATLVSSDIVFTWDRRTRLADEWVDSLEVVPIEDTADGYELEILASLSDNTPIRTITGLTDPTYTYLDADITTDFTDRPDTVFIRVYHMSTEVGRSLPERKELDVIV